MTEQQGVETKTLGFIGAGSMTQAFVAGLQQAQLLPPAQMWVTNRCSDARLAALRRRWGVTVTRDKAELAAAADWLLVAVKPQDVSEALEQMSPLVLPRHVVISVAAGVPISEYTGRLPQETAVVRAMPNTSSQSGASATGLAANDAADEALRRAVGRLFDAIGDAVWVAEEDLDAVTGLSGSGPAYVYLMVEALVGAGMEAGLERDAAERLARQTVYGAAKTLQDTGAAPGALREKVMSPGGTTVAGITALREGGFEEVVSRAVQRATRRAAELSGAR